MFCDDATWKLLSAINENIHSFKNQLFKKKQTNLKQFYSCDIQSLGYF